jgi:shikimate dehydrogenase
MAYKVGVIGWPVAHSISPAMHNAAFQVLGLHDWSYELLPIPPDVVGYSLRTLRDEGGFVGVNVTVPHKQAVMTFVKPDAVARAIGAVNTIDFRDDMGTNTDAVGFIEDLKANGITLSGARVILLGAGGAARAAVYGLVQAGAQVVVVNRTPQKAQVMLADLAVSAGIALTPQPPLPHSEGGQTSRPDSPSRHSEGEKPKSRQGWADVITLDEAAEMDVSLIVNCTSVGMWPHVDESAWIEGVPFPKGVPVYDMIYRPERTRLMEQAEAHGGQAINGLGMLVRQGAAAFTLWTKQQAPLEVMFEAARRALEG